MEWRANSNWEREQCEPHDNGQGWRLVANKMQLCVLVGRLNLNTFLFVRLATFDCECSTANVYWTSIGPTPATVEAFGLKSLSHVLARSFCRHIWPITKSADRPSNAANLKATFDLWQKRNLIEVKWWINFEMHVFLFYNLITCCVAFSSVCPNKSEHVV